MIVEARHMIAKRLLGSKTCAWASRAAALLWLFTVPSLLHAQDGAVAGTVVAQGNQRPLAGVEVVVAGTPGKGTLTDAGLPDSKASGFSKLLRNLPRITSPRTSC